MSGSGSAQWDWNKIRAGFTRINPGHYVRFDVDLSGKDTVYVSAITEDGILVADALARRADLSVIVGANAMIYDTKYGHVWKDTHDNYHGRRRRSVPDGIVESHNQIKDLGRSHLFNNIVLFPISIDQK